MKENNSSFSFESIGFIFRHPWFVIFPVVIILSITLSFSFTSTLLYNSSAIISLQKSAGETATKIGITTNELLSKILIGENMRLIMKETWPWLNEGTNPILFDKLKLALQRGIRLAPDFRDPRLVTVSFNFQDPNTCYKAVRATVDTIIKENSIIISSQLEENLIFLRGQVSYYKEDLKQIEQEEAIITKKLLGLYAYMDDRKRFLIREALGERVFVLAVAVEPDLQMFIKLDNRVDLLNQELQETQEKKETLQDRIKQETSKPTSLAAKEFADDTMVKTYSRAIEERELNISSLLSQGYSAEHPLVSKLKNEADSLKTLKESRILELGKVGPDKSTSPKVTSLMEEYDFQIASLKNKIKLIEKHIETYKEKFKEPRVSTDSFLDDIGKFQEVKYNKEMASSYYSSFVKQLGETELKNRIASEASGTNVRIIEEPKVPAKPIPFQTTTKAFFGLVLALGIGIGFAYIIDYLINSIGSSSDLRELLQIPVIGSIERISTSKEQISVHNKRKKLAYILMVLALISFTIGRLISFLTRFK